MPPNSPWYEEFFKDDYIRTYKHRLTEAQTTLEIDFVEKILELKPGQRVLDLCCGSGRHLLGLARRGLDVVGQDLNKNFLEQAKLDATTEALKVEVVAGDMRRIPFQDHFDAVINMFTSFGYLESEGEDIQVLLEINKALKPGGYLLMDMLNREWVVSNYIQNEWYEDEQGLLYLEHREIDLMTSRNHITFTVVLPDGSRESSTGHHVRLYTLTEMIEMFNEASLAFEGVYGGFQKEPYSVESRRMIVIGRRQ
jgi:SAM-dependent methyltransferase